MSKSSLQAAAEAAARVNAMLIARGKLKQSAINSKLNNDPFNRVKPATELVTAEVDINDAPLSARNLLTRGLTQDEISKVSGAAISTRGRYMTPEERQTIATPDCRPLYLNVQANSFDSVRLAILRIQKILDEEVALNGFSKSPTVGVVTFPAGSGNITAVTTLNTSSHLPSGSHFVQDKVFIGLEQAPPEYPVRDKIFGPGGSFLQHIRTETGASVTLRGKGSGFIEPTSGREAFEPLYIHITHPKLKGLEAAKALAINLVETAHVEFATWQQQQQQTILQPILLPQAPAAISYQDAAAFQNPVMVAAPGATSVGIQIPVSASAAAPQLSSVLPTIMNASVPAIVQPVSVVSPAVPVSVHGIAPAVISYPTYASSVLSRPVLTQTALAQAPASLAQTPLSQATLVQTSMSQAALMQTPMSQATFVQSPISQTTLVQSPLSQAALIPSISQATFVQSPMSQPTLVQSALSQSALMPPPMSQATFVQSPISQPALVQSQLSQAALMPPPMSQATFVQSAITQPALVQSAMSQAALLTPMSQAAFVQSPMSQPPTLLTHQPVYNCVPSPQQLRHPPPNLASRMNQPLNYPIVSRYSRPHGNNQQNYYASARTCLQESNVAHPPVRRMEPPPTPRDRELMPPPPPNNFNKQHHMHRENNAVRSSYEPQRKKLKGALIGIASVYGSDSSDEEEYGQSAKWPST